MKSGIEVVKLSQEELALVSGGYNWGNCNFHDFSQYAVQGGVYGGLNGMRAGPWGAASGAGLGALYGMAAYGATCWW